MRCAAGGWNKDGKEAYVENMVKRWKSDVECLSMIANVEPQAAFSALTKSVQGQWNYLQRVVPECDAQLGVKSLPLNEIFFSSCLNGGFRVTNPSE